MIPDVAKSLEQAKDEAAQLRPRSDALAVVVRSAEDPPAPGTTPSEQELAKALGEHARHLAQTRRFLNAYADMSKGLPAPDDFLKGLPPQHPYRKLLEERGEFVTKHRRLIDLKNRYPDQGDVLKRSSTRIATHPAMMKASTKPF